jgi:alkylhydroperoxidase family enzyme
LGRMQARLTPAASSDVGPLARAVARVAGLVTVGEPLRVFTTLGRHRRLFRAWLPLAATLLLRARLPRRDVELVVLRTAWNCSSPYEWVQHVALAHRAGLSPAVIAAVPQWRTEAAPTGRQRLLLAAVDELHSGKVLTTASWDELTSALDERQVIELCMLVGHYEMLAMTLNTLGTEPEPRALEALEGGARQAADQLQATLDASAS